MHWWSLLLSCCVVGQAVANAAPPAESACAQMWPAVADTAVPQRIRSQWRACYAARKATLRSDDRTRVAAWLREDLLAMYHTATAPITPAVEREADRLAELLVTTTRAHAATFGMHRHPMWHNFLIHTGAKQFGYCYHWTSVLAAATHALPWQYFARTWGVASQGRATENNALIITARGAPLATGLVYDAWRGAGFAYWRPVRSDHYTWVERFSESAVARGIGDFVWAQD